MTDVDTDELVSRRGFMRTAAGTAAVAGASGSAFAQDGGGGGGNESDGDGGGGDGGGGTEEVTVGPGGDTVFQPGTSEPLYIAPGTTVLFVWDSNTHNIAVDSQPDEANWEGHENIEDSGFEYEHTFDVEGTYEYHCDPHVAAGMEATIEVTTEPPENGGDGGTSRAQVPDSARALGVATFGAMTTTLGLAYFFMKYGGDYGIEE